ncbi:hypothetical protein GCM10011349_36530 [Novosphingobium indicum]|uniref:Polysaccharide biosynthesis protein C-terminal domain-containing protein n=1 Tax=Novosphingobium indicum TaxID=462949 RepID=A0ABQ2JWB3_9SPHN|nr:oligosaccharide flippase family protein [Novosphingobium indicum]GGN57706.1 hypothetical protein GCM10011349_36530 [Novosphingobium indicum]
MKILQKLRGEKGQYLSALIVRIAGAGMMYGMNVALARIASPEVYGTVAIGLAWGLVAMNLGSLGFNLSSIRFVAAYLHSERRDQLLSFLKTAILLTALGAFIGCIISLTVGLAGAQFGFLEEKSASAYLFAIPMILVFPFLDVSGGMMRGYGTVVRSLLPYNVIFPLVVLCSVGIVALSPSLGMETPIAFYCLYAGTACAIVVSALLVSRKWPGNVQPALEPERRKWISTSLATLPSAASSFAVRQVDSIILSFFVAPSQIALYWLAGRVTRFVSFGLQAAHMVASPQFARLKEEADMSGLQDIKSDTAHRVKMQSALSGAARATAVMALPSIAAIALLGPTLLDVAGPEYRNGLPVLYIILFGEAFNVICGPNASFMNMTGLQNTLSKISTTILAMYVPLIFLGSSLYGILGAAAAISLATIIQNIATSLAAYRSFGVNTTMFSREVWCI